MSKPALLALILLVPAVATASFEIAPAQPSAVGVPVGPGAEVGCTPVTCVDVPFLVDENGDTMTGPLVMQASLTMGNNAVAFAGGSLTASPALTFAGRAVCLGNGVGALGCGDITDVVAGFGLVGGATAGSAELGVSNAVIQQRVHGSCATMGAIRAIGIDGSVACASAVERIDTGPGLAGGPITSSGTLSIATGGVTSAMILDGTIAPGDLAFTPGDVTSVLPAGGSGLTLGGTEGDVVLGADLSVLQARVAEACDAGSSIAAIAADGTVTCEPDDGGWGLSGNAGTSPGVHFLGTTDFERFEIRVNNQRALRIQPGFVPTIIGGGSGNGAGTGVAGGVVAGGGCAEVCDQRNRVLASFGVVGGGQGNVAGTDFDTGEYSTVAGGETNAASGTYATIGGGQSNRATTGRATVSGGGLNIATGLNATVGGGSSNRAMGSDAVVGGGLLNTAACCYYNTVAGGGNNTAGAFQLSTVGGGGDNLASGDFATIGGGFRNVASGGAATVGAGSTNSASGLAATVPGGLRNTASGAYALAAGRQAIADDQGAFVWADSLGVDFPSTAANQFSARATGGVRFVSSSGGAGVVLNPGAGSWSSLSDRASKDNVQSMDGRWVLERVATLPVSTWNWNAQDPSIRHMGPMAQDFRAAFGLGEDATMINAVDADGVALAAIQGLYAIVMEQQARISELEARVAAAGTA